MNRYRLVHISEFSYDAPVSESYNEVRLRPMQDETQSCLSFRLSTDPASNLASHLDHLGNCVHRFSILGEHRHLRIEADSVTLVQSPPELPKNGPALTDLPGLKDELDEHQDFLAPTAYAPHDGTVDGLVREAESGSASCVVFALSAMNIVHRTFRYEKGATHVKSSIHDTLATGAGVCQDFAHILLAMLRIRGLPGRYVSGYLVPTRTAEPGANLEEVVGGQASHAWMEVFIPGHGWFGLDPTTGAPVGLRHVRIAYGRDYGDAAPVRGVYKGEAGQHLCVDVRVRPALDDEGHEHLQEKVAAAPCPSRLGLPQQLQEQQSQQ